MSGWPTEYLGDVCHVRRGSVITKRKANPGDVPVIAGGIGPAYFHDSANRDANVITVSGSGANAGFVNFFDRPIWASDCSTIEPNDLALDVRYVHLFLLNMQRFINENLRQGAAQPHVYPKDLAKLEIPLPPLEEQKRIVAVLDQAFAALDRARANAEANLADAEALPQAAVDTIFLSPSTGWQESTLGDVCSFVGGSQPPKSVFEYSERPGLIRLIQIRDYKSDAKAVYVPIELAKRFCDADDVMIGRYGPPLFQILRGLEGAYNVALMKAVPDESKVSKDFLFYFLKNREILRYIEGASSRAAGQAGINKATIEPYPILFPALKEQSAIVERLQMVWQRSKAIIKKSRQRLEDLDDLRQSILQKAFAGELT